MVTSTAAKRLLSSLHGGPGCTHDYVDSFKELAATGRAVVHYDQIGNGRSTHLRDKGPEFWTVSLFLDELDRLLNHLDIAGRYDIVGQSWGGMLAAEHAVLQPPGLRRLVIADSPALDGDLGRGSEPSAPRSAGECAGDLASERSRGDVRAGIPRRGQGL